MRTLRSAIALLLFGFLLPPSAYGTTLVADFDSFSEGLLGTEFIDGGIRFSDLEVEVQGGTPPFTVERGETSGWPQMSPPNYLTTLGYSPGPSGSLSQFRSFRITPSSEATAATMDLFLYTGPDFQGTLVTLTAFLDDIEVAMTTIEVGRGTNVGFLTEHHLLSVSSPSFDSLRIAASDQMGNPSVVLAATDNVRITLVPEPASLVLVVCGILIILFRSASFRRGA